MAAKQLKLLGGRIAASTMMEVIIAMVLIVLVFGIAMQIYANVIRLSLTTKKIKAQSVLNEVLIQSEQAQSIDLGKKSSLIEEFTVNQENSTYNNNNGLIQINLSAYDDNQEKVAEINQVIYVAK